jgi:hypothetical protein
LLFAFSVCLAFLIQLTKFPKDQTLTPSFFSQASPCLWTIFETLQHPAAEEERTLVIAQNQNPATAATNHKTLGIFLF